MGEVDLSVDALVEGAEVSIQGQTVCDIDQRFQLRLAQPGRWMIGGAPVEISEAEVRVGARLEVGQ